MEKRPYEPPTIKAKPMPGLERLKALAERESEFAFADALAERFPGANVYLVGGSVRDAMLGRPSKDYDFIVRGVAPADLEKFLAKRGEVNLVGRGFGVFKFRSRSAVNGQLSTVIDIALPRRDVSAGTGGYKDFEAQSDPRMPVEDDLARRDFTVNAMAWDVRSGELVDPHGGLFDLLEKRLKAVGDPAARFREDYSRMLRGMRLAAQLGFDLEEKTLAATCESMACINDLRPDGGRVVPYEIIGREFLKSLKADPIRTMDLWDETGAVRELMPELLVMKNCEQPKEYHSEGDVWVHTRLALSRLRSDAFRELFGGGEIPVEVPLAVLLHDVGKPLSMQTPEKDGVPRISFIGHDHAGAPIAREIVERLKLSSVEGTDVDPERIDWLVDEHLFAHHVDPEAAKPSTLKKRFFHPKYRGRDLLMVAYADAAAAERPDGSYDTSRVKAYLQKITELRERMAAAGPDLKPLLNGHEIMQILGLKPGPEVKKTLEALLDAQGQGKIASREDAIDYLKNSVGRDRA